MSHIIYVSPQVYLISQDGWKSDSRKSGYIPILKADLPKLQQSLQKVVETHGKLKNQKAQGFSTNQNQTESSLSNASGSAASNAENIGSIKESTKYQTLKHFLPIAVEQQLHTISLQGIPSNLSNESVEIFILKCIQISLEALKVDGAPDVFECWTNVQFSGLETQDVFVRIRQGNEKLYSQLCQVMQSLFNSPEITIEFHLDSSTRQFILEQEVKIPELSPEIVGELKGSLETLESKGGRTVEDDLSSVSYQIDLSTLSDLPRDSLDQLCKDITEFRTKVVSIEKEKREQQVYEESKRRRHQMMKMFHEIRKSRNKDADSEDDEDDNNDEDDDRDELGGDDDDADDYVFEVRRSEKEKEESARRYENMLSQLHTTIEPRIRAVQAAIKRAENYEQELLKNRPIYLKELLHQAHDQYYDHQRSFKAAEEQEDSINREQNPEQDILPLSPSATLQEDANIAHAQVAGEELDTVGAVAPSAREQEPEQAKPAAEHEQFKIKFAFMKAIDKSADLSATSHVEDDNDRGHVPRTAEPLADELPFTQTQLDQRLEALRASKIVDELVKENLGVYEDELVDYILDNIREHKNKQVLLDELTETFDDDAKTIVAAIWSSEPFVTASYSS